MKLSFNCFEPSAGVKNLTPVIFLHGMLDSRISWKKVAPKIAENTARTVYCIDFRNHGDSPRTEDFDFKLLTEDVEGFMKEHTISKAVLVGSSMGGITGMKLALEKPYLVEKLLVLDTVPTPFPLTGWKIVVAAMLMMQEALGAISEGANEETAKRQVFDYLGRKMPESSPAKNEDFALSVLPLKKEDSGYKWKTNLLVMEKLLILNEKLNETLVGSFVGGTMFLYGTESYMNVGKDAEIPLLFPNAVLVPVEGATHMVHFEDPEKVVAEAIDFINAGCC